MTTLAQILELAEAARRSPYARRVLFDALIDRYGDDFLSVVERAQATADQWRTVPQGILMSRSRLPELDFLWERERSPDHRRSILRDAFRLLDADWRWRSLSHDKTFAEYVLVGVVHPRLLAARRKRRLLSAQRKERT